MNQRPTGITILAIALIILGILSLLWSGIVFGIGGLGAMFTGLIGAEAMAAAAGSGAWSGFVGIIAAGIQIAGGIGLLALKRWAWYLALIAVGITVIEGIVGIFSGGIFGFLCGGCLLLLPVLVLVYLLRPNVRSVFGTG